MKIRTTLFICFLTAAMLPAALMGLWSYNAGVEREFSEVKDRHLLLAQSLRGTLERYHKDLTSTIESVSTTLVEGQTPPNLQRLLRSVNVISIFIVDDSTGNTIIQVSDRPSVTPNTLSTPFLTAARSIAVPNQTLFSPVMANDTTGNVILGIRRFDQKIAVSLIQTDFFSQLAKSISFGDRGHAAIIDHTGNLLAHPLKEWQQGRLNISELSIAQKMMRGESGIDTFYSPALKEDMIAGFATLDSPTGWGVMVPQPVSEIHTKVRENNHALLVAVATALLLALAFATLFVNSLAAPLENFLAIMKRNARHEDVREAEAANGLLPLSEITEFYASYNVMAQRVNTAKSKIVDLAYFDNVTGLPNRVKLETYASRVLTDHQQLRVGGTFVFIDVDNFKQVNDLFSHATGDMFLRDTARKLQNVVAGTTRKSPGTSIKVMAPLVARIGGDEFAILFPGMNSAVDTAAFLSALNTELTAPGEGLPFISGRSSSIGCSMYPVDGQTLSDLMKRADIAMYHAKKAGKNRHQIFNNAIISLTGSEMVKAVSRAIDNDEMTLEYQPKICAHSGRIAGVEALVRWDTLQHGRIMPDKWIPSISNTPTIRKLGQWVVTRAMTDQQMMRLDGQSIKIAINIGSEHFEDPGFDEWLCSTALANNCDPGAIEIELTEDTLFSSNNAAAATVRSLSQCGFRISIDDFGTGYSNIARLSQLSIDSLKIDRTILSTAHQDEKMASIMECIVMMAKKLNVETVAEGIECDQQISYCTSLGVDVLQGFYFSKSLPVTDLLAWAKAREKNALADHANPAQKPENVEPVLAAIEN